MNSILYFKTIILLTTNLLTTGVVGLNLSSESDLSFVRLLGSAKAETFLEDGIYCKEEVIITKYGNFTFPETVAKEHGNEVRVACPQDNEDMRESIYADGATIKDNKVQASGTKRKCFLESDDNGNPVGRWDPGPNNLAIIDCRDLERVSTCLDVAKSIESVTVNTFRRLQTDLNLLSFQAMSDHDCCVAFLSSIAFLLTTPKLLGENGITNTERIMLLELVESFVSKLSSSTPPGYKCRCDTSDITVEVAKLYPDKFYAKSNMNSGLKLVPYTTRLSTVDQTHVDLYISREALQSSLDQSSSDEPSLKILAYSDVLFEPWNINKATTTNPTTVLESTTSSPSSKCRQSINNYYDEFMMPFKTWGRLSVELDGQIENLTERVELVISNFTLSDGCGLKCVYWDDADNEWSTKGMLTTYTRNGAKCTSTHLTAFSALIEPLPLPFPDAEYAPVNNSVHGYILSILSSIGSVCSIIGLGFTVLTYTLFRSLRRERSNRILLNLSASLLMMHLMSLSGSKSLWDGHCFVPAASLHYLVLTSLAWMMVEAIHMFELLISVFVRPENRFLVKRFILAWGLPLVVVIICTIVEPDVYKVGRANLCLMSAHENIILYYIAYIGPICAMLLVNLVIFCKIFRVLYKQTKRTKRLGTTDKGTVPTKYQFVKISPSQIKGATTVLVLLGIGWILGLLAIGPFEIFFRYLYCICNAGQGAFIFIFRVVLNPHACKQWKKVILGFSSDSSLDVSVTTSSSAGSGKPKRKSTMISPTFISASNSVENSLTPSNPLSATLATTLASILRSEDERAAGMENQLKPAY